MPFGVFLALCALLVIAEYEERESERQRMSDDNCETKSIELNGS